MCQKLPLHPVSLIKIIEVNVRFLQISICTWPILFIYLFFAPRSFDFDKKRGRRHLGCGAILRKRRAISYGILTAYEKAFEKFGLFLARKPLVVLLLSVFVILVSCLGFVRLNVDQPSRNQFTVIDSQSRYDLHDAAQFFPLLEARQEQIIMTPKHGQNILSEDCLKEATLMHQAFLNISGYKKLCFRQLQNITGKVPKEGCVISSPMELAGANFEHLTNLSSILALQRTNPRTVLSDGQSFQSSFKQMLSNFQVNNKTNPPIAVADALRIIYFIKKVASEADQEVLNFETSFESVALSVRRRLKCAALSFKTGKRTNDALQSLLQPDIKPLYLSALTMVLFVFLVIYLSYNNLNCLTTILLTLLSVLLPQTCAAGIISMAGISLSPTSLFIPFLLVGKATSDVLLILGEWERQKRVPSLEHRVSSCVARAGTLQMLSAFCGAIILGIAIQSSFEVISGFFLVALTAFTIASFLTLTITVTLLLYTERHLKSFNVFCARSCTKGSSSPSEQSFSVIQNLNAKLQNFLDSFGRKLMSFGGTVISLFILACMVSLCVLSVFQSGERISSTENLYRQNENFKLFDEEQKKLFGNETDVSIVYSQEVDYSQQNVQDQMIKMCTTLGKATYSNGKPVCWMAALLEWANNRNMSCSNSEFHRCLTTFLSLTHSAPFLQDLRLKVYPRRFQILASRIHIHMAVHNSFKEDRKSLEKLRDDLSKHSLLNATPVSERFFELDDLFSLKREVVFCLIIASVVVFVSCLFSTSSFVISTFLTVTFGLLLLETAGIMETWGIHLNNITFISLLLTIILALNFSLQVVHSFIFSGMQEEGERMTESLRSVGWCVLIATSLAVAGSTSLGFIYPSLKHLFFQLIPLVFFLGLIHGLVILPPIVTLFVRFMERFDSKNKVDLLQTRTNQNQRGMSLQVWGFEASKVKSTRAATSIVGISCRFPGASSKDLFWNLLKQGASSISAFPQNREEASRKFPQLYHPKRFVSGRLCAVNGSYMEKIMTFDNRFFGISNQEARGMDPQQRILLEVVYEAIEDAGLRLEDLQRCRTGVFVGVMNLEFGALLTDPSNYRNMDQFTATGMTGSILANRVSFCLNLTGPSIAVDTACSSSLTALKIACDNLYSEDCEVAIVCASNIVLDHARQMASSMAGLLAPDGRCKSFDASGDGYGRGEGFAAVILKLSDAACSDKDDEYCEIISCGMNNDGQNAVPITAPSAKIQAKLSRMVLEQSGLNPEDVDFFEAHGTGTAIGDVIEITSIADTYTRGTTNPARKLKVGSVKSNLNHTESTSGLAGLIKVALMIKKKRLVPTVNVVVVNPKLKLEEKRIVLQQTNEPWNTENGKPRIGAVNSFGYGGSNVHAILREVTSKQSFKKDKFKRLNYVFTISARSLDALKQMAENYSKWIQLKCKDMDTTFVEDLCYSLNERRSQFPHRLAVPFESISEASKSLADYAVDSMGWENLVSYGEVKSPDTNLVFMFGGQGSQWFAMGRQLIQSEAVFKEVILTIDTLIRDFGNTWSLIDELMASEDKSRITDNSIAQPATFAIQYATAQLLMSWRIYPSAVLGHSLGEFAAACVAGIVTLKEAVHLVLTRSTLQDQCPNNGGMAALGMSDEKAKALLVTLKLSDTLDIAAVNDAESVTVSGDSQSIETLGQHLAMNAKDIFWRVLGTKRAFHSSHMEVIKKSFQAAMKRVKLNPQLSKIPMYSTVTGEFLSAQEFNRDYWWRNIRCPVQFYTAMKHVLNDGYKQIIEISTQPILAHYVKHIAVQEKLQDQAMPTVLATLPRKRVPVNGQHKSFLLNTVCKLYVLGFSIDWNCVQGNPSAKFVRSVTYPWQRNSFWYSENLPQTIISPLGSNKSEKKKTHPFLQNVKMTDLYSGLHCWETEIDLYRFPGLKDHALIQGGTVMPGAAYLEMAFAIAMDQFLHVAGLVLNDVKLSSILTLPETQVTKVQRTK